MKQGRTLAELGRELQRQRKNRQDFLADTRSLELESDSCGSTLHLSLDGKTWFGRLLAKLNLRSLSTNCANPLKFRSSMNLLNLLNCLPISFSSPRMNVATFCASSSCKPIIRATGLLMLSLPPAKSPSLTNEQLTLNALAARFFPYLCHIIC